MSNIDKQTLREAAEKATRGPWEMERENIWFTDEDGYTKHLAYVQQGDDVDDKQDHYNTAFIAAFNPKVALALLDEVEAAEHASAVDHEAACSLVEENEELKRRIAELEAKLANPVLLPKTNGYWTEQEKAYEEAITLAKRQVRLAGFNVEEM
ncbi:ead/Ea22-like family protein [Salmonella enterica]|nr:ead/Ea22-like family protein [Salmonella enterica]EJJ4453397.1 ead/Ea22-like family protein [Salmonella enterica]EJJ4549531.1 ead/Ea22-like family protein [Salmonella enterica]EJJ4586886.1 ead/Ea22-like family protein [Salmonella enterica]EJX6935573.1 ead/Ea22-like family protein [Salmonella enterica]